MFFDKYRKKADGTIRYYDLHSIKTRILCVIIFIICILVMIISIFPPVWAFLAGFKTIKEFNGAKTILPIKFDFKIFAKTWNDLKFLKYYFHSLYVVVGAVVCSVIFNGLLAYGLAILKPKGHKIIFALVMWSLLIPATTSMVSLFVNINRIGLSHSYVPLWFQIGANAFYVLMFKQFFESLPKELIEAAKLDGCGYLQTFIRIILPLSKSIVTVITIFVINWAWSDFLLPYLLLNNSGKETVMVRLYMYQGGAVTAVDILRAVVYSIIPPILIFLIFQKQITEGAVTGALKG